MDEAEQFAAFEEMGEDHVRDILGAWPLPLQALARKWLRLRRQDLERRTEAMNAEQARTARSAKMAATVAAIAAIAANMLAIIAIIVSVLTWLFPRRG